MTQLLLFKQSITYHRLYENIPDVDNNVIPESKPPERPVEAKGSIVSKIDSLLSNEDTSEFIVKVCSPTVNVVIYLRSFLFIARRIFWRF